MVHSEFDWGTMTKARKGSPEVEEARLRQQAIGARLRRLFDDIVSEPVPEDFLDILRGAEPGTAPGADAGEIVARPSGSEPDRS
jgi:hypothetical protein